MLSSEYLNLGSYYHSPENFDNVFTYTYRPQLEDAYIQSLKMREAMSNYYLSFLTWLSTKEDEEDVHLSNP
jgi:hypothetical protein